MRKLAALLACMTSACCCMAVAQLTAADSAATDPRAAAPSHGRVLRITSDPPGARVYRDTVLLGTTPLETALTETAASGSIGARLRIIGGEPGAWFAPVLFDSIPDSSRAETGARTGDTLRRHYQLPIAARIASDPSGADVLLGDSLLGTTPLFATVPRNIARVTLRREGYEPQTVMMNSATFQYRVQLVSAGPPAGPKSLYLSGEAGKSYTSVFIASGAAVVAGATAAWLKDRADRRYEEYRATGDGGALDRVRRYDLYSGIALAFAEISLGYLVIELLSR